MNDNIKILIALGLIVGGILGLFIHINKYRKDHHEALKNEFFDFIFDFPLVGFIFPLGLIVIGIGWLYYLLNNIQ